MKKKTELNKSPHSRDLILISLNLNEKIEIARQLVLVKVMVNPNELIKC
jgi:hypothetical protein